MTSGLRKFALTVHLTFSIGWIGAVVAYLALVVAAMAGRDAQTVRAAGIAMELTGWYVIVPLALASLLNRTNPDAATTIYLHKLNSSLRR